MPCYFLVRGAISETFSPEILLILNLLTVQSKKVQIFRFEVYSLIFHARLPIIRNQKIINTSFKVSPLKFFANFKLYFLIFRLCILALKHKHNQEINFMVINQKRF